MYAYLVCASGLQATFDQCHIGVAFQHAPVCDGLFGAGVLLEVPYAIDGTVAVVAGQCAFYGAAVFGKGAPYQCVIGAFGAVVEELLAQMRLGFGCLGYKEQSAGVFVDAVYQSYVGVVDVQLVLELIRQGVQ